MPHNRNDIQKLYLAYFSRPADLPGLQYWQQNSASLADIADWFSRSSEYTARFAGKDNSGIVQQVYYNLFGRDGEPAGVAYWAGLMDKGAVSMGNVVTAVLDGARNQDKVAVASKLEAMNLYCDAIANDTHAIIDSQMPADIAIARAWLGNVSDAASLASAQIALPGMVHSMGAVPGPSLVLSGHVRATGAVGGAVVFVDSNHNGIADLGEARATTDVNGVYLLSGRVHPGADVAVATEAPLHVEVVVSGGVDMQTGQFNNTVFTYSYDTTYRPYAGAPFKEAHVDFGPQDAHFHDAGITLTGVPAATIG